MAILGIDQMATGNAGTGAARPRTAAFVTAEQHRGSAER
jgi:hypothetical protein